MALDVDGFAVLRTIGVHPHIFKAIAAETAKAACTLVVKQMTNKNSGLKTVRDIRAAIGREAFSLILDGMSDAQIKSLTTRLDKHAAQEKIVDGTTRMHVLALADGSTQPAEQPPGGARTGRQKKTPAPPIPPARINYKSAGASRSKPEA